MRTFLNFGNMVELYVEPYRLPNTYIEAAMDAHKRHLNLGWCWKCPVCTILNPRDADQCGRCMFWQSGLTGPYSKVEPIYATREDMNNPAAEPCGYVIVLEPQELVEKRLLEWSSAAAKGHRPWHKIDPALEQRPDICLS